MSVATHKFRVTETSRYWRHFGTAGLMKEIMGANHRHNRQSAIRLTVGAFLGAMFTISVGYASAWAQSGSGKLAHSTQIVNTKIVSPTAGLTLNIPSDSTFDVIGLSPTLSGALIDIPVEGVGSGLFNLDIRDANCFAGVSNCFSRDELGLTDSLDVEFSEPTFLSLNSHGLDLELTPRASLHHDDESSSALIGAFVRIGDDLRKDSDFSSNTWYFFAGADAEALTYRPNSRSRFTRGNFNLQDRIIVGDAQAGVGYRIGDADLSLAYIRRGVSGFSSNDVLDEATSYNEEAAAISFTWRR